MSCVGEKQSNDPKRDIGNIKPIEKVRAHFNTNLPKGWLLKVTKISRPPFQWNGKVSKGYKVLIVKKGEKEKIDKSYKAAYKKGEQTYYANTQLIRYFYTKLDAGYSFRMMERSHPAFLERVTDSFVVIAPSSMSDNSDRRVSKEVYKVYRDLFKKGIDGGVIIKEDYYNLKRPINVAKKYKGKMALIYEEKTPFSTVFGVVTIK